MWPCVRFTYDANGNILTQVRRGSAASGFALDSLTYHYASNKNQLTYVDDAVSGSAYSDDIDDQSSGNYEYDEIGNLIADAQEQIASIEWTVYGKIKRIIRTSGSLKPDLEFEYSPDGHRVCKIVKPKVGTHIWNYTYYVRDAQGNIMATYDRTLKAIFDPEQTNYEDVNNQLLSLNGSGMFQGFIFGLHPEVSSADFIDSLQQALLSSDLGHQMLFINTLPLYKIAAATDVLTNNGTAYNDVLSQLDNQEFTEAFLAEFGKSDLFSNICFYDLNFINTCVGYDYTTYLTNFATYLWSDFDQMHYDIMGFHEYGLVNAVSNLGAHQSDVISWILLNGSCTLNTIVCSYFSNADINGILNSYGYGNCR
ncbi:MAG: hypothetical protein IT247_07620, partial [Bacteroidia bacterium]|nr:hypothetical protein [Bacteroidia bacterium]